MQLNRAIERARVAYNKDEIEIAEKEDREPLIIPHFSAHHLRHTFCTRLCENESNLKVIQSIMGHSDITTTMDVYAEATQEKKQEIVANLQGKDYNISRELSCYLKRQSIYQNNLYNTNDTADLWLYGPQWKTEKNRLFGCVRCLTELGGQGWKESFNLIPTMRSLDADKASSKSKNGTDSAQAAPVVEEKIDFSKVQIEPLFTDYVDFDTFSSQISEPLRLKSVFSSEEQKASSVYTGRWNWHRPHHFKRNPRLL